MMKKKLKINSHKLPTLLKCWANIQELSFGYFSIYIYSEKPNLKLYPSKRNQIPLILSMDLSDFNDFYQTNLSFNDFKKSKLEYTEYMTVPFEIELPLYLDSEKNIIAFGYNFD